MRAYLITTNPVEGEDCGPIRIPRSFDAIKKVLGTDELVFQYVKLGGHPYYLVSALSDRSNFVRYNRPLERTAVRSRSGGTLVWNRALLFGPKLLTAKDPLPGTLGVRGVEIIGSHAYSFRGADGLRRGELFDVDGIGIVVPFSDLF